MSSPSRRINFWLIAFVLLLGYLIGQNSGLLFENRPSLLPRPVTARGDLAEDEKTTIELFETASPSVVFITTVALKRGFFSFNVYKIPKGTGSGFVWDKEGHVITNYHVIKGAQSAEVTLADHSVWKAKLVGAAPDKDLAVLKIAAPQNRLQPIQVGTSHDLKVGQKVLAIGNPFGLDQTLTTGVISGLEREIKADTGRPIQGVIQTDAAINPGNSGGPLLDSAGRLIGINTAIFSPSGAYAGIGFAVPVDTINRFVPQLISSGKIRRAGLGIRIAPDHLAKRLGVEGVIVVDVVSGSAAAKAGVEPATRNGLGDVIISAAGERVRSSVDLFRVLDRHKIGDTISLGVLRADDSTKKLSVTLQELE